MKPNLIGIVGGILALISLLLPWWTMIVSSSMIEISYSADISIYPYKITSSAMGISLTLSMDLWFGWTALALIVLGGLLEIYGSLVSGERKMLLMGGGLLSLLSLIIFAVGLQNELSKTPIVPGISSLGLFSSGSISYMEASINYSAYLSFGFWLALIAAIIMFIAALKKTEETVSPSTQPQP